MELKLPLPSGIQQRMETWSAKLATFRHGLSVELGSATSAPTLLGAVDDLRAELQLLIAQSNAASELELTNDGSMELDRRTADHDREGRDREQLRQVRNLPTAQGPKDEQIFHAHAQAKRAAAQAYRQGRKARRRRRRRVKR